ncbi:MAG: tetratricopeptide repeat protein, partial [Bacteroidales bacterium]|nr:tetratricopeptide repeat protein [Bacteroidales bacterium]
LQNIGVVYSNQEEYDKTIEFYGKALKIFHSLNNLEGIASVENNLGLAYERKLQYKKALEHYQKSLTTFQEMNSRLGLAYLHDNMASLYRRLQKTDIAIHHYQTSLLYADSVNVIDFQAFVHKELASLYEASGNYEKSLYHFKTGSELEDSLALKENLKKLSDAQATFQGELKDVEIQKKEFQLNIQKREKYIYLAGLILLTIMLGGLIWLIAVKLIAENAIRKHREMLERSSITHSGT